jgi:dGTPase
MNSFDYTKKITTHRELYPIENLDGSSESDRGRVISSAAFRRLQKRTQVFALELDAAIRTRLTHSLEVSQTARYIAKTILKKINNSNNQSFENSFITICEMSSLLHDIGNPPFGHFGEMAINEWIEKNLIQKFESIPTQNLQLKQQLIQDITSYDGNAQAIRIVHKLQRMNLSYSQIASIIKYTRGAYESKDETYSYLSKKPGYFFSEKEFVQTIQNTLDIKKFHRFPLTYIMESADDISYLSADIEDAVDKNILTFDEIHTLVKLETQRVNEKYNTNNTLLFDIIDKNYNKAKTKEDDPYQFNMFLTLTRATLIGQMVNYVSDVYIQNHEAIFNGSFNSAILEYDKTHPLVQAIEILKNISYQYIYTNKMVQTLELKGYSVLNGLLDIYKPLFELSYNEFLSLVENKKTSHIVAKNLFARLPKKHLIAYKTSLSSINNEKELMEYYFRVRLLIDYISGMTDDYALFEYKSLSAI